MGTAPLICGCKRSNVVQPSASSAPTERSTSVAVGQTSSLSIPAQTDLIVLSEFSTHSVTLQRKTIPDINNNNNGANEEHTDQPSQHLELVEYDKEGKKYAQFLCKYDFQKLIGEGSFSKVHRVKNKQTNELYALKIISKNTLCGTEIPNYDKELKILSRVKHQSIVTLYEVFHTRSKVYLVLELATGGDLYDRLSSKGHFSEPLAKTTVTMITSGLSYLHQLGITHRDIKLENLLYKYPGDESQIVISDFGLGYINEDSGNCVGMLTTCGSAEYLAPEMLDGDVYSSLIDTWALGVIAYTILCGSMPFVDQNRATLYRKIKSGKYSFVEEVCYKKNMISIVITYLCSGIFVKIVWCSG